MVQTFSTVKAMLSTTSCNKMAVSGESVLLHMLNLVLLPKPPGLVAVLNVCFHQDGELSTDLAVTFSMFALV